MKVVAAILAAGRGQRFGADKTQILLRGKPLWLYSYETYLNHPEVTGVGLVCSPDNLDQMQLASQNARFLTVGGDTRQESSKAALEHCKDAEIVLIHDAARPFVSPRVISDVIKAAAEHGAAAPGIPVTDTIKLRDSEGIRTLDRSSLIAMQTPQGARREILEEAFRQADSVFTDEMAMIEATGVSPSIVEGDTVNFKITTPEDLIRAAAYLGTPETRTGMGYDVHAFSTDESRPLMLGGVAFPGRPGLEGHSDADALLHAIVDSLLGSIGLGDIGTHFPNTDLRWKDEPSLTFLAHAGRLLKENGWRILNIDATVIAETPKVMKQSEAIRKTISHALDLDHARISVKATTNEKLGSIGRGEGIAALAISTVTQTI